MDQDPDLLALPHGGGLSRSSLSACRCPGGPGCQARPEHAHRGSPCGVTRFYVTRRTETTTDPETGATRTLTASRVVCPRCIAPRPGEFPTHLLDVTTGEITRKEAPVA